MLFKLDLVSFQKSWALLKVETGHKQMNINIASRQFRLTKFKQAFVLK